MYISKKANPPKPPQAFSNPNLHVVVVLVFQPFLKPRCCRVHPLDDVPPRHEDHEGRHAPQIVWGADFHSMQIFVQDPSDTKKETIKSAGSWKHENNEVVF